MGKLTVDNVWLSMAKHYFDVICCTGSSKD